MRTKMAEREGLALRCQEVSCTLDFEEALETILDNVSTCLSVEASAIHLYDAASRTMDIVAVRNLSEDYIRRGPVPLAESPVDKAVLEGSIRSLPDMTREPAYSKLTQSEGIRSAMCAPLKSKDKTIGTLWAFSREPREFADEEINYLRILSSQGGVVLGNAKLYQSLHALSQIGRAVTSRLDLSEILQIIVERAASLFAGKGAAILLVRDREMDVAASHGLADAFFRPGPTPIGNVMDGCLDHLMVVSEMSGFPEVRSTSIREEEGIHSAFCTPLRVREKSIGVLRVYMDQPRDFSTEDLDLIQILSDFGGISIENARLFGHIKRDYEDLKQDVWHWYDWGERAPEI